jgi:uncharacterized phage-associated protein
MKIPIKKLKLIIRYFCTYTDKRFLGKTKLMKLFYFLDFNHVKKYGAPITYDRYVNMEHGPIPSKIMDLVCSVSDEESLLSDTIYIDKSKNQGIHRIKCYHKFTNNDRKYFAQSELETLGQVVNKYKNCNKDTIENDSHKEAPWKYTKFLQEIPYTLATKDDNCKATKEEIELVMEIANE